MFLFFKQRPSYEVGGGDWSSDVCSSDLFPHGFLAREARVVFAPLTRLPSCSAERRLGLIDGETQVGVIQFKAQIAGMNKLAVHNKDALDRPTNHSRHLRDLDIGVGLPPAFGIRRAARRPHPPAAADQDQAAPEQEEQALPLSRSGGGWA